MKCNESYLINVYHVSEILRHDDNRFCESILVPNLLTLSTHNWDAGLKGGEEKISLIMGYVPFMRQDLVW